MKKVLFIKNALILTATSIALRFAGIIFKVWLAAAIGSEGIGLFQLVFSVYVLAATFATSGISTAVTRLVTEELAVGSKKGVIRIMSRAFLITIIAAALSQLILTVFAAPIAAYFINDMRAVLSLRILAASLVFMGLSSCIRGYFFARRKALPGSITQILEQAIRIIIVFVGIKKFSHLGTEYACAAVLAGDVVAEAVSFMVLYAVYRLDKKRISSNGETAISGIVKNIMRIAAPISGGRYANTMLRTTENMLVPRKLTNYGMDGSQALSVFGMIKGMALPILFFPSSVLNAVSTLLMPEVTDAMAKKYKSAVRLAVSKTLRLTWFMGLIFGAVFFIVGDRIGMIIYKSEQVGYLIKWLSPIVPLMYLDSISDGMLKGMDQQMTTFRISVVDSVLRIILVLFLLPLYGMTGFLIIMYISNLLTCLLNVGKLLKVADVKVNILQSIVLPIICALLSALLCGYIFNFLNGDNIIYSACVSAVSVLVFVGLLFANGVLKKEDLKLG